MQLFKVPNKKAPASGAGERKSVLFAKKLDDGPTVKRSILLFNEGGSDGLGSKSRESMARARSNTLEDAFPEFGPTGEEIEGSSESTAGSSGSTNNPLGGSNSIKSKLFKVRSGAARRSSSHASIAVAEVETVAPPTWAVYGAGHQHNAEMVAQAGRCFSLFRCPLQTGKLSKYEYEVSVMVRGSCDLSHSVRKRAPDFRALQASLAEMLNWDSDIATELKVFQFKGKIASCLYHENGPLDIMAPAEMAPYRRCSVSVPRT
jgi:hypothetical protein